MREISLNGYIDESVWFGDEITPDMLHTALYGEQNQGVFPLYKRDKDQGQHNETGIHNIEFVKSAKHATKTLD